MRPTIFALLVLPLALTACGEVKKSFDEGVEKGFKKEFANNCTTSVVKTGAPPAEASKLCSCMVDRLQQKYSGSDLLSISEAEMMKAADLCIDESGPAAE